MGTSSGAFSGLDPRDLADSSIAAQTEGTTARHPGMTERPSGGHLLTASLTARSTLASLATDEFGRLGPSMDQNAAGGGQDRRRRGRADAVDPQDHGFMYGWSFYDG